MKLQRLKQSSARAERGFTIIELMIALAIVSILVGIAVPMYNDSVRKARRGQAKADLAEAAQAMERFYTLNNAYTGGGKTTVADFAGFNQSPQKGTKFYDLSFDGAIDASTFKIIAKPVSGTGQEKDDCGTLSIDNTGKKLPATPEKCWN
ncbi:type IV pilin protein [Lysobacter enzymogenes]|uniref:type IV pilin protein n=1 Tax=Lysobacter enzymogenes TaxID=69 RepID=UPI00384AD076